jgi:DNA adenine methylase
LSDNRFFQAHYVEPYAGGAGAALKLLFEEYVDTITINDADPRVAAFWMAVTTQNDAFLERLSEVEVSVQQWIAQRAIYEECSTKDCLALGFAMFYLNRTTRSGIVHNGGPIGGFDQAGKYGVGARFNREGLIRRIARIGAYSERIHVSQQDGIDVLRGLISERESGRPFLYLDPPYYVKGSELYLNRFSREDHERLALFLSEEAISNWLLTYDDVEPVRRLYASFSRHAFFLSYSAYQRRTGREILFWPESIDVTDAAIALLCDASKTGGR